MFWPQHPRCWDQNTSQIQILRHFEKRGRDCNLDSRPTCRYEHKGPESEPQHVRARNIVLKIFLSLLSSDGVGSEKSQAKLINLIGDTIGPDFFILFLSRGVADSTVALVMKVLSYLLQQPKSTFATKFRGVRGFDALCFLLPMHCHLDEVFMILFCMLLGKPAGRLPSRVKFRTENLRQTFGSTAATIALPEILPVLLCLLQALQVQPDEVVVAENKPKPDATDHAVAASETESESPANVADTPEKPAEPEVFDHAKDETKDDAKGSSAAPLPGNPFSSNPFSSKPSSGSSAKNPFLSGATSDTSATKPSVPANPFLGGPSRTEPAPTPTGASANPFLSGPVATKPPAGNPFARASAPKRPPAPVANKTAPSPADNPFAASAPRTWHEQHADTLLASLLMLYSSSENTRAAFSSQEVVELVIAALFVHADLAQAHLHGNDSGSAGVVTRHVMDGATPKQILIRLCEPGGWPLRGFCQFNARGKFNPQVVDLVVKAVIESLVRGLCPPIYILF